jgi:FAD/FMN-containing dehydrogenase
MSRACGRHFEHCCDGQVVELDKESQIVAVQAGIQGDSLGEFLGEQGLTLCHYRQSMNIPTIGRWIVTQATNRYSVMASGTGQRLYGETTTLRSRWH